MSLGNKIKKYRKAKGLTQKQLAKEIDVTASTVTKYENESLEPNIETTKKIANALNISLDALTKNPSDLFLNISMDDFLKTSNLTKEECLDLCEKIINAKDYNDLVELETKYENNDIVLDFLKEKSPLYKLACDNVFSSMQPVVPKLQKLAKEFNNIDTLIKELLNNPLVIREINIDFDYSSLSNKELHKIEQSIFFAIQLKIKEIIQDRAGDNNG